MGFPEDIGIEPEEKYPTNLLQQLLPEDYPLSEEDFWSFVEVADWPNKDYDEVSESLRSVYDSETASQVRWMANQLWNMLDKLIGDRNPAQGSDDSHSDLLWHIVGLGKDKFYAHLNDYSLIQARGVAKYGTPEGYRESFIYCLPYPNEYPNVPDEDEFKDYEVVIKATITKTIIISADNEDEAIEAAQEEFTTECEGPEENYNQETVSAKEVE